jgi:uncharacterized delta-60 repeat protein
MKTLLVVLLLSASIYSIGQAGTLLPNFGSNGKVITAFDVSVDEGRAISVQTDGKIIVAGITFINSGYDFALARYNTDGTLDNSFDEDGKVVSPISAGNDIINAVVIQTDGKIVVVGETYANSSLDHDFLIARYNDNGTLDNSFNGTGFVITSFGLKNDWAAAVALQTDGKIVVAGHTNTGTYYDFALARYNTDGTLDNSFDGDGKLTTDFNGSNDEINALCIQGDGKIVAAGYCTVQGWDFALARYNSDGSLDTSFDGDGKAITPIGTDDVAKALSLQSDGKIVAGGRTHNGANSDFALVRYNIDGSLDNSFDGDGKVTNNFSGSYEDAWAMAIQNDGKILLTGIVDPGSFPVNYDITIARYMPNGMLDNTFDSDGIARVNYGTTELSKAIGLSGSRIYIAGRTNINGTDDFLLLAFQNDVIALPLSIEQLEAVLQTKAVKLNWKTFFEKSTSCFDVERSLDGNTFSTIGSVKAVGNSTEVENYSFTDVHPAPSLSYYRLRVNEISGNAFFSAVVIVRFKATQAAEVYPNPVRDVLHLYFYTSSPTQLLVKDILGNVIKKKEITQTGRIDMTLDVSSFQSGLYFLQTGSGTMQFLKQ